MLAPLVLIPTGLGVLVSQASPAGAVTAFTPGDLVVYRVGNGGALSGTSAQVFLDEYSPTGTLVESVPMPTSASGLQGALTASGSGNSEGLLTLSANGNYLMATGYDTPTGTANVGSSLATSIPRTVGRVDASGAVDTSTLLTDFASGNNPRSAASSDGTNIWVGGAAGGVRYATLGATTSTSLNTADKNVRGVSIYNGQLYTSADPTKQSVTIAPVGSGLPTTAGQTITNLPFSSPPSQPYGYVFEKLGTGANPDTLYVADNANAAVERYNLVSGVWTAAGSAVVPNLTGLAGIDVSGTVTLYATASGSNGTSGALWKIVDSSGAGGTLSATPTSLVSLPAGTAFRGVAFAPGTNLNQGGGGGFTPTIQPAASGLPAALGDPTNATMGITVGDPDPSVTADQLTVTASSSDTSVAPQGGISVTGTGANRTLTVTPGVVGTSTITLTVTAPDMSTAATTIDYGVSPEAPDPDTARYFSGAGNASTAVDVGGGYMIVGDDESDVLRLYQDETSGPPVATFDFTSQLPFGSAEVDIEASARTGNRIYWLGSMSNDSGGAIAPARSTLFATDVSGSGASTTLTYVGSYTGLRQDFISWDQANGNQFGLAASAGPGVPPHESDSFNAEGLEFAPGSTTTAYIGFRGPLESPSTRDHALVVPITNIDSLVTNGNPGTVHASFGPPLLWDLGGLAVREFRRNADNQYLIIAGGSDESPGQVLYKWDGVPADPPRQTATTLPLGADRGNWESLLSTPEPLVAGASFNAIQDNGDTAWYGDNVTSKNGLNPDLQKDLGDTFVYEPPPPLPTTTLLGSSKNPSNSGDTVTFTATVSVTSPPPGAGTPTGTVEFTDNGTDITGCSAVAVDGSGNAQCAKTFPVQGSHNIVANYSGGITGNDVDSPSTSSTLVQGVGLAPSSMALTSTADPVGMRQSVSYLATITGAGTPTGTVEFTDNGVDIAGCSAVALDNSGVAKCTTRYSKPTSKKSPPHPIAAAYSGDNANTTSSGSLTETVSKKAAPYTTTTSLTAASTTVIAGHPLAVTATVTTASGSVTGKVKFLAGSKVVQGCKAVKPNPAGVATCNAKFSAAGSPSLTAMFHGDKYDKASTSAPLAMTVTAAPTDTDVTSSANPVAAGHTVTFSARLSSPDGGTPGGNVTFSIGGTPISGCTARPLSGSAIATCTTKLFTTGVQTVQADYSGSGAFSPSSGTIDETVS